MNDPHELRARAERWRLLAGYVIDARTIDAIQAKVNGFEPKQMGCSGDCYPPATSNSPGSSGK